MGRFRFKNLCGVCKLFSLINFFKERLLVKRASLNTPKLDRERLFALSFEVLQIYRVYQKNRSPRFVSNYF